MIRKNRFIGSLLVILSTTTVPAQNTITTESNDSISVSQKEAITTKADSIRVNQLEEIVVEGKNQRVIDRGVEYTPTKREKKAAMDATRLLMLMGIPQLHINPGSMAVTTSSGKGVAMFIDYLPATQEDLEGLRTEDVLRVEVLQYPEDSRFGGQANVVNFIMRKYEWGGYTKLTAIGNTINIDRARGMLYSKFVSKRWTFDANLGGYASHNDREKEFMKETFRDVTVDDRHFDLIMRTTRSDGGNLTLINSQNASFRAVYSAEDIRITHSLSFVRVGVPRSLTLSTVDFSEDIFSSSSAELNNTTQSLTPRISGNYYFNLPKGHTIFASWSFAYGSRRRNSSYMLGELNPIINNNKEKSYEPVVTLQYSKKLPHNNTFRTTLMTYNTLYQTNYQGSYDGYQKLLSSENMLFLEYMHNWKSGLSLYSRLGMSYVHGRLNGESILNQWNPRLGAQLQYTINEKNSASIEGWWGNNHPTPSSSNSAIVQSNELMWLQGNPDLRNSIFLTGLASYTYIPTNRFNLSAYLEYHGYLNKTANMYYSLPGYDGLVRKEINSGDFHEYTATLSATLKLLRNSLSISASGNANRIEATGIDAQTMTYFWGSIQANYFFKNCTFSVYYQTPSKYLEAFGGGVTGRWKSLYGVLVNYAIGNFKAGVQFRNWFNRYKYYSDLDSERYSSHGWQWNSDLARSLQLSLTYTFPYGKKVKQGNEIKAAEESGSAILK